MKFKQFWQSIYAAAHTQSELVAIYLRIYIYARGAQLNFQACVLIYRSLCQHSNISCAHITTRLLVVVIGEQQLLRAF